MIASKTQTRPCSQRSPCDPTSMLQPACRCMGEPCCRFDNSRVLYILHCLGHVFEWKSWISNYNDVWYLGSPLIFCRLMLGSRPLILAGTGNSTMLYVDSIAPVCFYAQAPRSGQTPPTLPALPSLPSLPSFLPSSLPSSLFPPSLAKVDYLRSCLI